LQAGWNIVDSCTSGMAALSSSIVDATVFSPVGTDACTQINQALNALPGGSGTVDARGLTGTLTCSSNPFSGFTGQATVLLGAATWQTTATWIIPSRNRVFGIQPALGSLGNTIIQWKTGNPSGTVVQLGSGTTPMFGIFVGDLTIDCNVTSSGGSTVTGLLNVIGQEESGANNITFNDCSGSALNVSGPSGSQNSGPYTILNIKHPHDSCKSTTLPVVYTAISRGGIVGLTVVADSCSIKPAAGVDINGVAGANGKFGSGIFEDIHCENMVDCIRIGNSAPTRSIVIGGVEGCPKNASDFSCSNVIHICSSGTCAGGGGAGDIVVEGIGMDNGTGNLLQDDVTGTTIPGSASNLGFYALGNGATPNLVTSDPTTTSEFNAHLGSKNTDTVGTCTLTSGACPSITFNTPYQIKPVCTANLTTAAAAVKANPTLTSLAISSTAATGTVSYICVGNPN
jgi:hypothetical protein